jgi:two-component system CheB/CheR fusion protein
MFLEPPPGQPQVNLLRMARDGLGAHLHEALERAKAQSTTVRAESLRLRAHGGDRLVSVEVVPLAAAATPSERFFLVILEEEGERAAGEPGPTPRSRLERVDEVHRLEGELAATTDYLQSLIGERENTAEELAATNEELIAANEELQSTNEELQSAKEELQSANEELSTLNDQLRTRNLELDVIAGDLVNVLASVEIAVIIVDLELKVRRFTPKVREIARFIPADVGRSIQDLKLDIAVDDLGERISGVIAALAPKEWEVRGAGGRWLRMQIRPYRTVDDRLDGAVLSFVDVDDLKHALDDAVGARDYARSIVEAVSAGLIVLDRGLRVVSANSALTETLALAPADPVGRTVFELGGGVLDLPALRRVLERSLEVEAPFSALELVVDLPHRGRRVLSATGRPLVWGADNPAVLLALEDVTELRGYETERAGLLAAETAARVEAEQATRAKDFFLATLSHELRTPVSTMLVSAQLLEKVASHDPRVAKASAAIVRSANTQARLIDDLLDVSRIVSGKLIIDSRVVDLAAVVAGAVDLVRSSAQAKSVKLELEVRSPGVSVLGDPVRLEQVVTNLLTNAIKFTPPGGCVSTRLVARDGLADLSVRDTGMGMRPEVMAQIFGRFVQADNSITRSHGGLGLGLAIVRHLVEAHGGLVHAESPGEGKGSTFHVTLPTSQGEPDASHPRRTGVRDISGIRVLLVEDQDDSRDAHAMMLGELGAEVRTADSAARGLAALEDFRPQVIVSDIAMPGEDGYSFIRQVRALAPERGGLVPAAALTALATDEDREKAIQSGFQMHLAKPVDSVRLATVIAMLAASKPPADVARS